MGSWLVARRVGDDWFVDRKLYDDDDQAQDRADDLYDKHGHQVLVVDLSWLYLFFKNQETDDGRVGPQEPPPVAG